jgi:hypothetical protein
MKIYSTKKHACTNLSTLVGEVAKVAGDVLTLETERYTSFDGSIAYRLVWVIDDGEFYDALAASPALRERCDRMWEDGLIVMEPTMPAEGLST